MYNISKVKAVSPLISRATALDSLRNFTDKFIDLNIKFLNSRIGFWIAYLAPLLVIWPLSSFKPIENVLSSNWIQLWALFGLAVAQARTHAHVKELHSKLENK